MRKLIYHLADAAATIAICYLSIFVTIFVGSIFPTPESGNVAVKFFLIFFISAASIFWLWWRFSPFSSRKLRGKDD